ncbi:MAG: STAS domain-containing protein [Candidatus Krumholzibacteriia bacterium]
MGRNSLPPPGFSRADLHVHTVFSDGTLTPEEVLNYYALHPGFTVFAITDHDTIDGALHARRFGEDHPELFGHLGVIVGEEVTSRDGHVIGLFLKEWIPPGMSAAETVNAIHTQDGIAIAAHPYTNWMRWHGLVGVGDLIKTLPFDAVETHNSNFTEVFANRKSERNAGNKARVGASDGHFLDAVGVCYTEFPGSTAEDMRRALLEKTTRAGGRCYGVPTLLRFVLKRLRTGGWIVPKRRRFKRKSATGDLEIQVHRDSWLDAAILAPRGKLDARSMPELKETVTLLTHAKIGVVLDLAGVEELEPAGITALVAGMKSARENGVGFCIVTPSPACERALRAADLSKAFPRENDIRKARKRVATQNWEIEPRPPELEVPTGSPDPHGSS